MSTERSAGVRVHTVDGVAVVDLGERPLDIGLDLVAKAKLLAHIREATSDPAVVALLFTSPGGALSAGEYRRFLRRVSPDADGHDGDLLAAREEHALDQLVIAIDECPKVTAIALAGEVVGPFLGLALACDVRLAAPHAIIDLGPVDGVPAGGGLGFFLPLSLGLLRARELILSGRRLHAAEAHDLGLVTEVLSGTGGAGFVTAAIAAAHRWGSGVQVPKVNLRPYAKAELEAHLEHEMADLRIAWRHHTGPPAPLRRAGAAATAVHPPPPERP